MKQQQGIASFSSFSILIVFLVFCLVGLSLMPLLSVQLFPSHSYASVGISSYMPDASPQVTEAELTTPIESTLARLNGIKKISSSSGQGSSSINIELDKWTDPEMFLFEASTMMRQLYPKLPKGSSYPQIYLNRPDANKSFGSSIIGYTLNGPGTPNEIAKVAEKLLKPLIAKLKGVNRFEITGARPIQLSVIANNEKMQAIGLSHGNLANVIATGIKTQDLGLVHTRQGRFNVTVENNISVFNHLSSFPVAIKNGRVFTLNDVGRIKQETVEPTSYYRINGEDLVSLSLYPDEHVNVIKLVDEIKKTTALVERKLPAGYKLSLSYDKTEQLKEELNKIYLRTFLSIAILLAFVLLISRQARYMLIIIASLAVNILISFIFYYFFKLEIHLYSLAGITISLGLVIDNVIVIVEDIRHTGRNRIFAAILASTLTALGALSVIFFLDETQKINLLDFALAIIINLIVSLPIAYFFIPAMLAQFPVRIKQNKHLFKKKRKIVWLNLLYHRQLCFMLRFRWLFILFFILVFGLPAFMLPDKIEKESSWAVTYNKIFGSDFYNQQLRSPINKYLGGAMFLYIDNKGQALYSSDDESGQQKTQLSVNISMPNGATLEQMNSVCVSLEHYLQGFNEQLEVFTTNVGSANYATINISFKKAYENGFPFQLKQMLETWAISLGSADFQIYGVGRGFSNAINMDEYDSTIALKGYNYGNLQGMALQVKGSLERNPRVSNVLITTASSWEQPPYREYLINFTRLEYLNLFKIGRWNMSGALQQLQEQTANLGNINVGNDVYQPVVLISNKDNKPKIWNTMYAPLQVNDSTMLRIGNVSDVKQIRMGEDIIKVNQSYLLNVHYQFIGTGELNHSLKKRIVESMNKILPFGYTISDDTGYGWWGSKEDYTFLWLILLVALIIYMICGILLESLTQPLAVVMMIPFSFIGVFLVFYVLGLQFGQGAYAALLMLAGIVTNSALYVIHDVNFIIGRNKKNNVHQLKNYIKAFNMKIMPVVVTTISAILSMLPFVINNDEKGFWFTLSAGTIGGLLFSLLGVYLFLPLCLLGKTKHQPNGILSKSFQTKIF